MSSQGPNSGGTFDGTSGSYDWANSSNASSSNDSYTVSTVTALAYSSYLQATNFGFTIPVGATINGVKVEVEIKCDVGDKQRDATAQLVIGGSATGDNLYNGNPVSTTESYVTYGGATALWGLTPTVDQINASNFGVTWRARVTSSGITRVFSIDHVRITIYYTPASTEYTKELGDTVSLSDSLISKGVGKVRTDTVSLSDSFSRVASFLRTYADTVNLSDVDIKNFWLKRSDTISLTDELVSFIVSSGGLTLLLADIITLSDLKTQLFGLNEVDTITLNDGIKKDYSTTFIDNINLNDVFKSSVLKILSDSITISDSLLKKDYGLNETDTISLSDNFNTLLKFLRTFTDTISLSDSLTKKDFSLNKTDIIHLIDNYDRIVDFLRTYADNIGLSDGISKSFKFGAISDTITLSDSEKKLFNLLKYDNVNISDSITKKDYSKNLDDEVKLRELINVYKPFLWKEILNRQSEVINLLVKDSTIEQLIELNSIIESIEEKDSRTTLLLELNSFVKIPDEKDSLITTIKNSYSEL